MLFVAFTRRGVHREIGGGHGVTARARGNRRAGLRLRRGGRCLTEHRSKEQLRGLAHRGEHGARVGHAGHRDDHVFALEVHFGTRNAQAVHPVGEDG